ncbi:hypothetical protein FBU30_010755 [Linnemannia zychae]|nr:hypothetical protein FBU30_010755 [Linnemannia zychae]
MPPAPLQARNRGSAAPHHYQTELATPEQVAAAKLVPPVGGSPSTKTRSSKGTTTGPVVPPPALANGSDVIYSASLRRTSAFRRLLTRGLLLYLGYTFFFVCPRLKDTKSNAICNSAATVENWIRPYTEPIVEKMDKTYQTYAEPYVDQYGRPLYHKGQKYYVDVAQPAIMTASTKAKHAYQQYAYPHIDKIYVAVYTPKVKARVNQAEKILKGYQKQAKDHLVTIRKAGRGANDEAWKLYAIHVQPWVDKMSPHAKVAWDQACAGTILSLRRANDLYYKHINPYAERTFNVIVDAADNARESFAFHTDEIWGTKLSKKHKKSKVAQAADKATEKAHKAKIAVEKTAKKLKHEPEPETFRDTMMKKAAEAQKLAEEYTESAKKLAGGYSESVRAAILKGADDAKMAAQEIPKVAEEEINEASKLSERIKKTIIQKAHEAQEAVARQAENLRHTAQEQVEHVQEAGAHLRDSVVGAVHGAKEAVDKEAEYVADVANKKKKNMEKLAKQQATAAKLAAQQKEEEARKYAEQASRKLQEAYDAAATEADDIKSKVRKTMHDTDETVRKQTDEAAQKAQKAFKSTEDSAEEAAAKIVKTAKKEAAHKRKQATELKNSAEEAAHENLVIPAENAKQKILDAQTAAKVTLTAMLAGIEESFGRLYEYEDTETKNLWSKLQSSIDEYVKSAKRTTNDLQKANHDAYESFESYIRDWRNQGSGTLEDRLAKLKKQSAESIEKIDQRVQSDKAAAKAKLVALNNNVYANLNDLKSALVDRLETSKKTIMSDINMLKDTSKEEEESVRNKLTQLEMAAKARWEKASNDGRDMVNQLLRQADEIWANSEAQSREFVEKTQTLVKNASNDAKLAIQHAVGYEDTAQDEEKSKKYKEKMTIEDEDAPGSLKSKLHSAKDSAALHVQETTDKMEEVFHEMKDTFSPPSSGDEELIENIQVAPEEPSSGHRHHRY